MLLVGAVLAFLLGEIALRMVLFHGRRMPSQFERTMRQPARYSDGNSEDDYWKLMSALAGEAALEDAPGSDPIIGWMGSVAAPGTYAHPGEGTLGNRRPVLLYGDSFAACLTPSADCFQSLLERSEFGPQYAMLNYGVGGFGLDQTYLLLKHSIDRFKDKDPIVIVSILVDSDLDRSVLGYRSWPKPRLDVIGDQLVSRGPVLTNTREYLKQHPISIRSYLWRLFLYQNTPFMAKARASWRGDEAVKAEKQQLNRKILLEIEHELSSRNFQHFFMVFQAEGGALKRWSTFEWQEQMIEDVCAERAIPLVDTRAYLAFAAEGKPENGARFYGNGPPLFGHHNALGNVICFEAIRQGLRGYFGPPDMRHLATLLGNGLLTPPDMRILSILRRNGLLDSNATAQSSMTLLGKSVSLIPKARPQYVTTKETASPPRLLLRSDAYFPNVTLFHLAGETKRFTGRLHTLTNQDQGCGDGELRFTVAVDDEIVLESAVPPATNEMALDFDLLGKRSLCFAVMGYRGRGSCNWICIEDPRLE